MALSHAVPVSQLSPDQPFTQVHEQEPVTPVTSPPF